MNIFHIISILILINGALCEFSYTHPLDPLSPEEITETVRIIYEANPSLESSNWVFNWITLKEPPKALLLPYFLDGIDPHRHIIQRKSLTVLHQRELELIQEVIVNLDSGLVESWKSLPSGTHAFYSFEENVDAEEIAKEDKRVIERCKEMGWNNMSLVFGEVWGVGYSEDRPVFKNALRPTQLWMYGALFEGDNHFAHPFDFVVTVDLAIRKVIQIDNLPTHSDYDVSNINGNSCPKRAANYDPAFLPRNFLRKDLNPIHFSQPHGASYKIRGNEVSWQKYKFRIGFNGREGLLIHHVSYQDGIYRRPLFYRMSVAELFVPYGDPRPPYHQKYPFDEGEFTLGLAAIDQKTAGICRGGTVAYFQFYLNSESGLAIPYPAAVCIHEEDAGLIWAHWSRDSNGKVIHVRSQRLTVTCFSNLGNYDYKMTWHFYQDGSIEFRPELHGQISAQMSAVNVTEVGPGGTLVSPQINGQFHQHIFGLRIDPEIDGNLNSVSTLDIQPLREDSGSKENPYGNGISVKETVLKTQKKARTNINPLTGRTWLIRNPGKVHPITKKPVGYKLVPHNAPPHITR